MAFTTPDKQIFRFLDTNGDGSGTTNAIGDYSLGVEEFYIQPPAPDAYMISRMIVCIEDTASMRAERYGNLAAALTNGIQVFVDDGTTEILDLVDNDPVKTNAGWGRHCYDADVKSWGAGDELLLVRWTFEKSGHPILLESAHRLVVSCNDDLTGLVAHNFQVQGYIL